MFCTNCGSVCADGTHFCSNCGAAIASSKPKIRMDSPPLQDGSRETPASPISSEPKVRMDSPPPQNRTGETPTSPAARVYCPHCGATSPANYQFCVSCGQRLQAVASVPTASAPTAPTTPAAPAQAERKQPSGKKPSRALKIGLIVVAVCLVLILAAVLVLKLVLSKPNSDPPEEPAQLEENQILSRGDMDAAFAYAEQITQTSDLRSSYLFDMDGDNVCELILYTGAYEAEAMFHFYSYYGGSLHKIGSLSAGHSGLYVQDGKLIVHYGQMGYEKLTELTLQAGELVSNCVLDRELGENEEYKQFDQRPYCSEGEDLSVLEYIYPESNEQIVTIAEEFTAENGYFTNGARGYALLPGGRVISVDAETGKLAVLVTVDADATLFAVTKNRLYFHVPHQLDEYDTWGKDVFSYKANGGDYQLHDEAVDVDYQDGYILLTSYRSDVSPKYVTVIDSEDNTLISDVYAWDAVIYNGAVYCCEIYEDEYRAAEDAYWEAWVESGDEVAEYYTMSLCQVQSTGKTNFAYFTMDCYSYAWIDSENARMGICVRNDTVYYYDLLTGSQIS